MSQNVEEFKFVHRKKKKNWKTQVAIKKQGCKLVYEVDADATARRLTSLRREIITTEFYKSGLASLCSCISSSNNKNIEKLVCFGIGSFGTCLTALHQLAFILEIIAKLGIKDVQFYDPVLSTIERNILAQLNCNFLEKNCEGKYRIDGITAFYLPHCPKQLTNNLLWCNWRPELLVQLILIGNSFASTARNTPERFLKQDAEYLLLASEFVTEVPLENNYKFEDIFNDTAIHLFRKEELVKMDEELWRRSVEPSYADTELITGALERDLNINSDS